MHLNYFLEQVPPGYEDAEGINIVHCFFESYHASGVQDSVGKDARLAMIRDIGFKLISIYDYHECMVRFIF
jgi:hypothetical protein